MSARERVEAQCITPGRWVVEGWDVKRRRARYPMGDRWTARNHGVVLLGPTLEDICGQIIDWQDAGRNDP